MVAQRGLTWPVRVNVSPNSQGLQNAYSSCTHVMDLNCQERTVYRMAAKDIHSCVQRDDFTFDIKILLEVTGAQ